jgi:hypothetical protein
MTYHLFSKNQTKRGGSEMVVYKVFYKNYKLKKGELIGSLMERRKDLRGKSQIQSGLRWAKLKFGHMVKDKQSIFIVPKESKSEMDGKWFMEKGIIFGEGELDSMVKLFDREMKRE